MRYQGFMPRPLRAPLPGPRFPVPALLTVLMLVLLPATPARPGTPGNRGDAPVVPDLTEMTGRIEVDAMEYPWSAIGRVNVGGRGHCTGFLIGPRSVLTAAHCLYDRRAGRWRGAIELHFVAGYQRDRAILHAPVADYVRSSRFDPRAAPSRADATADWAVLTLTRPLGRDAGWLGLRRLDAALLSEIRTGRASLLQAGYRRGWTHIMSLGIGCTVIGRFAKGRGIVHDCDVAKGDSGSPLLVLSREGALGVIGMHVIDVRHGSRNAAGALLLATLGPGSADAEAAPILRRAGAVWDDGRPPADGSPARRRPAHTVMQLLARLGRLSAPAGTANQTEAIAAFEAKVGLPVTGRPSMALLGRLIAALPALPPVSR